MDVPSAHTPPPFDAYRGQDPFLFISYAHKDSAIVFPELKRMSDWGVHIWFDEGIDPGNEWTNEIAFAIKRSAMFILFVSPSSIASRNCRNEINFALSLDKPFVSIHIVETRVADIHPGTALSIESLQAVMKFNMTESSYERKLRKVLAELINFKPDANDFASQHLPPLPPPSVNPLINPHLTPVLPVPHSPGTVIPLPPILPPLPPTFPQAFSIGVLPPLPHHHPNHLPPIPPVLDLSHLPPIPPLTKLPPLPPPSAPHSADEDHDTRELPLILEHSESEESYEEPEKHHQPEGTLESKEPPTEPPTEN